MVLRSEVCIILTVPYRTMSMAHKRVHDGRVQGGSVGGRRPNCRSLLAVVYAEARDGLEKPPLLFIVSVFLRGNGSGTQSTLFLSIAAPPGESQNSE